MSDCGCCDRKIPVSGRTLYNRPALSTLAYRCGTFSSIRRALIDAAATESALTRWTSRDSLDFGIELFELWAYLGDILTFYQERIANEAFLRTAVQRDSLMRLAALIDYQLAHGVAAQANLAFMVDKTNPFIPSGLRVQSKAAPGQSPAIFETETALSSSLSANQFRIWPVPTTNLDNFSQGCDHAILFSGGEDLKPGQSLIFFSGKHVEEKKISDISTTECGQLITWSPQVATAFPGTVKVYRFGRKFSLFGSNAPDKYITPVITNNTPTNNVQLVDTPFGQKAATSLDLDGMVKDLPVNTKVLIVILGSDDGHPDFASLFTITGVHHTGKTIGLLSGAATRIHLYSPSYPQSVPAVQDFRTIQVYELTSSEVFFSKRNFGSPARILATTVQVYSDQVSPSDLHIGSPVLISDGNGQTEQVEITALTSYSAELVKPGTLIQFTPGLANTYPGETALMYGNVARATHGETVKDETLGGGNGAQAFQKFMLKKSPVTFTPDENAESGVKNSLQVMVNGVRWTEAPNFYDRKPNEQIYVTSIDDGDQMHVEFGDGVHGARLPTGVNNIHARYRKGWGKAGSVSAGKLTTLLDAKPGLKSVTNPGPSFGWAEPETLAEARQNAPTTVLTFDRAVSLRDFETLARSYPGVAKARAAWVWHADRQVIRLTCAATDGVSIVPIRSNLLAYLNARRDPNQQVEIEDFKPVGIKLHASIVPDPARNPADVLANAQAAVSNQILADGTYGFFAIERLDLDEDIHLSEVYSCLQGATGVIAVYIEELYRKDTPANKLQNIVPVGPAELAVIASPADVIIELKDGL